MCWSFVRLNLYFQVSPSGSEAIATKNTIIAVVRQPISPATKANHQAIQDSKNILERIQDLKYTDSDFSAIENSLGSKKYADKTLPRKIVRPDIKPFASASKPIVVNAIHANNRTSINNDRKGFSGTIFRPIKSPNENGSSVSDKDVTSGGKEVHNYMSVSPKIDIYGSDGAYNEDSYSSLSDSHKLADPKDKTYKHKDRTTDESVQEKIKRITTKYSTKRGENKFDIDQDPSIENKIKSIKEKYSARRENILEGHGIRPISDSPKGNLTYNGIRPIDNSLRDSISRNGLRSISDSPKGNSAYFPAHTYGQRTHSSGLSQYRLSGLSPRHNASRISPRNIATDQTTRGRYQYSRDPLFRNTDYVNTSANLSYVKPEPRRYTGTSYDMNSLLVPTEVATVQNQNGVPVSQRPELQPAVSQVKTDNKQQSQPVVKATWERFDESPSPSVVPGHIKGDANDTKIQSVVSKELETVKDPYSVPLGKSNLMTDSTSIRQTTNTPPDAPDTLDGPVPVKTVAHGRSQEPYDSETESANDYQKLLNNETDNDLNNTESTETYDKSFERKLGEHLDLTLQAVKPVHEIIYEPTTCEPSEQDKAEPVPEARSSVEHVNESNLSLFEDVDNSDNSYTLSKPLSSAFAAEMDDLSMGYDTNSQSYIDLPGGDGSLAETDLDTDTEAVKREFYKHTGKIKDMLEQVNHRPEVHERQIYKQTRNIASPASSQG